MQPQQQEETTIIIQNPDGTIQLATQPHLKKKRIMECWKCKLKLVYNVKSKLVQCCYCNSLNGVINPSDDTQYQIVRCIGCQISLRANENAFAFLNSSLYQYSYLCCMYAARV